MPWPEMSRTPGIGQDEDGEARLHYQNFSIAMHAQRRLAIFTAKQRDRRSRSSKQPEGRKYTRKELSGPRQERSGTVGSPIRASTTSPRILDYFYTRDDGNFDKGPHRAA